MRLHLTGSPFGIAWFFLYGYHGVPAAAYLPALRGLGAGFTKVYLFWQQVEPERGRLDWSAIDAFVAQLESPDEALVSIFSTSQWAVTQPSALLPPSPATNPDDYYHFVYEVVRRCRGRVRYWQNDAEPNSPVFWSGTKEAFVAQLEVFYRAVKDADPDAQVVVGGYDGMFVPPALIGQPGERATPFPQQAAALAFFRYVIERGGRAFDLFDLRLYGDPYTIVARVDHMRALMREAGYEKPIVCTEYGGPNFFEFPENHQYRPMIATWSQAVGATGEGGLSSADRSSINQIGRLYAEMATLAPQTQMFMQGCSPDLEAKYQRLQSRSLVMRNLFALSAGVQKTLYWDLLAASGERDDLMTLMYGKIGLLGHADGALSKSTMSAETFARMAATLAGVREVTRIPLPAFPTVHLFEIDRGERGPIQVVWERRDTFSGEDVPAIEVSWPWRTRGATATSVFGTAVPAIVESGRVRVAVSADPTYLGPGE